MEYISIYNLYPPFRINFDSIKLVWDIVKFIFKIDVIYLICDSFKNE